MSCLPDPWRRKPLLTPVFAFWAVLPLCFLAPSTSLSEILDRGAVAVPMEEGGMFFSWRWSKKDDPKTTFHLVGVDAQGARQPLNEKPISDVTWFRHDADGASERSHFLLVSDDGHGKQEISKVSTWQQNYHSIPVQCLPGYRMGDASLGDLDGDGNLELVIHQAKQPRDNSHSGLTGRPILDAYQLDGSLLWRLDLGINIRDGEHYTQFMIYDLDGDGAAEVVCKTADGSVDGTGQVIGDAQRDWRTLDESSKSFGRVLHGPEYLSVFRGSDGKVLQTVDYVPSRDPIDGWGGIGGNGNNDPYGNRCDRFMACVAYLDGERPSVVMCRGVYGRIVMVAWDWRGGQLSRRWVFDSGIAYPPFKDASPFSGMGGHSLSVGDVDDDGRDEVVYQAMTIDDDGKGLYTTGRRHGDSMHLADLYPDRPGLELMLISENEGHTVRFQTPGMGVHDAATGKPIWTHSPGIDVGSGMAADVDPTSPGYEVWGGPGGLRNHLGEEIAPAPRHSRWALWWDGDLLRELTGRGGIYKWDWNEGQEVLLQPLRSGGSLERPCLSGDILGDWREEILLPAPDQSHLRLYTSTIPTRHRMACLLEDRQYRLAIAWQNVVYNKPPHPSFYLGHGESQ